MFFDNCFFISIRTNSSNVNWDILDWHEKLPKRFSGTLVSNVYLETSDNGEGEKLDSEIVTKPYSCAAFIAETISSDSPEWEIPITTSVLFRVGTIFWMIERSFK